MNACERLAENRIQEAIESGGLVSPVCGAPLDLSEYFAIPAADRIGISLLRNAGAIPPEIEFLRQAAALEREIAEAGPAHARELCVELQQSRVGFRMAMERRARAAREH